MLHPAVPLALALALLAPDARAETAAAVESRLGRDARFLASDELGGRGLGTPGLEQAARYVAGRFDALGLRTVLFDGQPFQRFDVTVSSSLGDANALAVAGPDGERVSWELEEDFTPLAIGGGGAFDLPLVFVGYGITAPEADYDDYAGVDVEGKAVVILRHEPRQADPHSAFNGTEHSIHAPFTKKVSNAVQHGAAAVIFTTDRYEIEQQAAQVEARLKALEEGAPGHANPHAPPQEDAADDEGRDERRRERLARRLAEERDPLLGFEDAGTSSDRDVPVLYARPSALDRLLAAAGRPSLAELEAQIDEGPTPHSFTLTGWTAQGRVEIEREQVATANVVGVLEGEGPHAEETIVIGAHYDHLGRGGQGSAAPGSTEVHNGADDNASGVAVLMEVARALATRPTPLPRRVVFIAFTGEERGLLGSAEYVRDPVVPMDKTIAMLNMDMVGRLDENKLIVNGTGTAEPFDALVDQVNAEFGFELAKSPGGFGPSDHSSFYAQQVPVLHFFTGTHPEYHRPGDDFGLLNLDGMRRVARFVTTVAERIATGEAPSYVEVEQPRMTMGPSDPRPYFGSIPDFGQTGRGYGISGVAPGSPAAVGGLEAGDRIVKLGEYAIGNLEDFDGALRKHTAGDRVKVVVLREGEEETLEVVLDPPK